MCPSICFSSLSISFAPRFREIIRPRWIFAPCFRESIRPCTNIRPTFSRKYSSTDEYSPMFSRKYRPWTNIRPKFSRWYSSAADELFTYVRWILSARILKYLCGDTKQQKKGGKNDSYAAPTHVLHIIQNCTHHIAYRPSPKYKGIFYINIESKRSLYLGTQL